MKGIVNFGINNVVKVLQGKRSHAGGFVFLHHGQEFEKINSLPIEQDKSKM